MNINKKLMYGSMVGLLAFGGVAVANMVFAQGTQPQHTFITQLAQALGISDQKLTDALQKVATQNVNTKLSQGLITSKQATELKQDIADGKYRQLDMFMKTPRMPKQNVLHFLLQYLQISKADFMQNLHNGKTIITIIESKGKTVADTKAYLITQLTNQIQADVKSGKITPAQATDMINNETTLINNMLSKELPFRRHQ